MASTHPNHTFRSTRLWPLWAVSLAALLFGTSCSSNAESSDQSDASPVTEQQLASTPELLANDATGSDGLDRGCEMVETLCIGLAIAPGAIPLSYLLGDLQQVEAEYKAIVEVLEAQDVTQLGYKVQDFSEESFDIVVVVGDPTGVLISRSATDYPDTTFISLESVPATARDAVLQPNLISLSLAYQDAGFLAGALAALTTETGKVAAVIGPDSDPAAIEFKTGFEAGAQFIDPQIQLFTSFHPTSTAAGYDDPLWASSKTREVMEQGVDVVVGYGGITGSAALVEAARQSGSVLCIGTVVDHQVTTPEASRCLGASAEAGLDHLLLQVLVALVDGENEAVLGDNAAAWADPAPATLSVVSGDWLSGDVIAQMDEIIEGLRQGTIP